MSSALVTLITLICGLFIGLALGIWISKIKSSAAGGGNEKLAQELNDVRVLLKASEDRLKAAVYCIFCFSSEFRVVFLQI